MRLVYVCAPYRGDTKQNALNAREMGRMLYAPGRAGEKHNGIIPIVPHLYVKHFVNEDKDELEPMEVCKELVSRCDYLYVENSTKITAGMREEISWASRLGIPVIFWDKNMEMPEWAK